MVAVLVKKSEKEATWLVDDLGDQLKKMRPNHGPKFKSKSSMKKNQEVVARKVVKETRKFFVLNF